MYKRQGDAILDHLGQPTGAVAEHRHSARHGLERGEPEALAAAGQEEEVAGLQDRFGPLLAEQPQVVA